LTDAHNSRPTFLLSRHQLQLSAVRRAACMARPKLVAAAQFGACGRGKGEIPRQQFPRSILVANVTRMSLTCHTRGNRACRKRILYEDASDLSATTSRACCARGIWRTGSITPGALTNQVSVWKAERKGSRPTRTRDVIVYHPREDDACVRRVDEDVKKMLR